MADLISASPVPSDAVRGPFPPADPASAAFREAVGQTLERFLDARRVQLDAIGAELAPVWQMAHDFTAGGKRLRPAFCYWGYVAAAGQPSDATELLRAASSLDLLHVSALVHDDVMDASDTRRGLPAAHKQFETIFNRRGGRGADTSFGRAGAILLGDLLVMWSTEMLAQSGVPAEGLARALPLVEAMRTEVTAGQYLDVVAQSRPGDIDVDDALSLADRVVEFKSARYTVQRPVQFGAALGGAAPEVIEGLAAFGSPLGKAFQFRDDILGVFGDEALTGKPAGDDLREGKRTVLVAHAFAGASTKDAAELRSLLGSADLDEVQVEDARAIIIRSGALDRVEQMISAGHDQAMRALDALPLTDEGREALTALAAASVNRTF